MDIASLGYRIVFGPPLEQAPVGACGRIALLFQADETQAMSNVADLVADILQAGAGHYNLMGARLAAVELDIVALACSVQGLSEGLASGGWTDCVQV
jgi:hypothetical protein